MNKLVRSNLTGTPHYLRVVQALANVSSNPKVVLVVGAALLSGVGCGDFTSGTAIAPGSATAPEDASVDATGDAAPCDSCGPYDGAMMGITPHPSDAATDAPVTTYDGGPLGIGPPPHDASAVDAASDAESDAPSDADSSDA